MDKKNNSVTIGVFFLCLWVVIRLVITGTPILFYLFVVKNVIKSVKHLFGVKAAE